LRTALDTNVLSALWSREPVSIGLPGRLGEARNRGALVVSPVVYAELLAHPKADRSFVDSFLDDTGIVVDFHLERDIWLDAGGRLARYAAQRRKSGPDQPKRLLADFVIGSHALLHADRLMTLDIARYRRYFPELNII
jgi:predicted nucleic acid-binding protein